jgi:hypothetical protein
VHTNNLTINPCTLVIYTSKCSETGTCAAQRMTAAASWLLQQPMAADAIALIAAPPLRPPAALFPLCPFKRCVVSLAGCRCWNRRCNAAAVLSAHYLQECLARHI